MTMAVTTWACIKVTTTTMRLAPKAAPETTAGGGGTGERLKSGVNTRGMTRVMVLILTEVRSGTMMGVAFTEAGPRGRLPLLLPPLQVKTVGVRVHKTKAVQLVLTTS